MARWRWLLAILTVLTYLLTDGHTLVTVKSVSRLKIFMNRFDDYLLVQWILCNLNTNSISAAQIWSVESENMMKDPISDGCLRPGATLVIVIILTLLSLPSSHIMISSHSHQQMAGQTTWIETIRETAEKCPYCELLL